jgi:hypothetical protein
VVADAVLLAALDTVAEPEAAAPDAPDADADADADAEEDAPVDAEPRLLLPSGAHSLPLQVVWA